VWISLTMPLVAKASIGEVRTHYSWCDNCPRRALSSHRAGELPDVLRIKGGLTQPAREQRHTPP
jgi:hypothetical protein